MTLQWQLTRWLPPCGSAFRIHNLGHVVQVELDTWWRCVKFNNHANRWFRAVLGAGSDVSGPGVMIHELTLEDKTNLLRNFIIGELHQKCQPALHAVLLFGARPQRLIREHFERHCLEKYQTHTLICTSLLLRLRMNELWSAFTTFCGPSGNRRQSWMRGQHHG